MKGYILQKYFKQHYFVQQYLFFHVDKSLHTSLPNESFASTDSVYSCYCSLPEMKNISKLYLLPLNSEDTPCHPLQPLPWRVLLMFVWMESLSLLWRRCEGWGIFRRCRSAARSAGVGPGREQEINADGIDVDVEPYVENTMRMKYRLLVQSRLISEFRLSYWVQRLHPL